ncbi:VWD domain-containing protein [Micromonospora sp. LAH09]|uniref:VWD domain-containing protein n=1 Tax=Micromonospora cabrerizensis TaxID=2911213 RepID=UPI001EE9310C|nr:VWD domain-containing protein [Micromonospora cabrerizensis]MCG5470710.1 VWD domain-containing protein [Micromonospora cabrerizensis]
MTGVRSRTRLGVVLAGVLVLLAPQAASAVVSVNTDVQAAYAGCVAKIRSSGNGAVLDALERSGKQIKVRKPIFGTESSTTTYVPGSDVQVNWWPDNDGRALPEEGAGFTEDRCATLIHEMNHALDEANDTDRGQFCTQGGQFASGVDPAEVHAVLAENAYRKAVGLPTRTTYSGMKLPSNGKDCDQPRPRPPGGGGCSISVIGKGYRCANSNGDPHLLTFDGLRYDFQAAGEFVLTRSTADDFEVQVRQTMFPASSVVAVNSAVALRVAGDRVGVYQTPDGPVTRVNGGPPVYAPDGVKLPRGGTVTTWSDGTVTVDGPDGVRLIAHPIGVWGLSVSVGAPPARAGTLEGLLGDHDGDPGDDLTSRGGARVSQPPTFESLYPGYADSWRVEAPRSLFDYEPGQSTATFTDRRFPDRLLTVGDLPNRATAELVCRRAGVTDPQTLADCALDVGLTGQVAFAEDAARTQRDVPAVGDVNLEVTRAGATAAMKVPGRAGQKIFVEVPAATVPDRCGVLVLLDPQGRQLATGCVISGVGFIDTTTLTATGDHQVVLDPWDADLGRATVRVVTVTDEDRTLTMDGPAVRATLAQPGAISRLAFAGRAGQKIFLQVTGATVPDRCNLLRLRGPAGDEVATGCVIGGKGHVDGFVLPADGRYVLEVDGTSTDTGWGDVRLRDARDEQADSVADGRSTTLSVSRPGAVSRLRFPAAGGRRLVVEVTSASVPDRCAILTVTGPDGDAIGSGCVIGGTERFEVGPLTRGGTYALVLDPWADETGSATVTVRQVG